MPQDGLHHRPEACADRHQLEEVVVPPVSLAAWPHATCTVIVTHADGSTTTSTGNVPYEPGSSAPGPVVRLVCIRACAVCDPNAAEGTPER